MIQRTTVARRRPAVLLAALAAAALALPGCAGQQTRQKSAQEWYEEGTRLAAKKNYPEAVEAFREASKTYRDADLDADIQLALADAQFSGEEFAAAVESYGGFLRLHAHHPRADYAQLRVALSWARQMGDAEHSQGAAQKAAAAYEMLLRGYPRSSFLEEARQGLVAARGHVAAHELSVGEFYMRRKSYRAAAGRFEVVLREYGDLSYAESALYQLGRCYEQLLEPERAAQFFEQLRREYPQSRYLQEIADRRG